MFRKSVTRLSSDNSIDEALQAMNRDKTKTAVVVNENDRLLGVVNRSKFFEFPDEYRKSVKLDSVMIKDPFFAYTTDSLHSLLLDSHLMSSKKCLYCPMKITEYLEWLLFQT